MSLFLIIFAGISFPYLIIFSLHSNDNEQNISLGKLFKEVKPFALILSITSLVYYWSTLAISDLTASFYPFAVTLGVSALCTTLGCIIVINLASKIFIIIERKLTVKAPIVDNKGNIQKCVGCRRNLK